MDEGGTVYFGVYPGFTATVQSDAGYNDGDWHHVVASLGTGGMALYLDGQLVGQRGDVTTAQSYSGYWRGGGGNPPGRAPHLPRPNPEGGRPPPRAPAPPGPPP